MFKIAKSQPPWNVWLKELFNFLTILPFLVPQTLDIPVACVHGWYRCPPRVHIIPYTLQHLPREDYVRCAWRTWRNNQIQSQTNAHPHHIHPPLCLRDLDTNIRITEEDQSRGNEMLPLPFAHFIQGSHHKWNSVHKNTNSHRPLRRSTNNGQIKEVTMVRTRDQIKWHLQKGPTRHSTREKKKGKTKEKMGRQHQRVDRSRVQQQSESSRGPSEMEEECHRCQQWCPYDPGGSGTQVTCILCVAIQYSVSTVLCVVCWTGSSRLN